MDGSHPKSIARAVENSSRALSAAALAKRLDLKKRARDDATRNLPRADADSLSETERMVIDALAAEGTSIEQSRIDAGVDAERRLRALAPPPQDFSGPTLDSRLMLRQVAGRIAREWSDAVLRAAQARDDLAEFKRAQNLRRAAVYPRSGLLQAGLLLCAAVFEALFSAALFAEDDARGLLGGAITAIGLSSANVTLGFLSGFLGLRYLQHVSLPTKAAGAIAFAAFAMLALMLNLFAADWRDQLAALSGTQASIGGDASFHLWSLLQLDSPQAIILLMLGASVWVFAALKGYSGFDDPYPDYGKMDRAARDATDALSDVRAECRQALEAPVNTARAALAARLEKLRLDFEAMQNAFDAAALKIEALDARARALDQAAANAIALYRQENLAARSGPAPAYFTLAPPSVASGVDVLANAAAMVDDARSRLAEAQALSAEALASLVTELDEVTARLDAGGAS